MAEEKEEDFKSEELNFPKVISFELNRIYASEGYAYENNIQKFADSLIPYYDQEMKTDIIRIRREEEEEFLRFRMRISIFKTNEEIKMNSARKLFSAMMGLIGRKGWLIPVNLYAEDLADIEEIDPIFQAWIHKRQLRITRYNQNWLCLVAGQTGSGKSFTAGRIAELIDPSFLPAIEEDGIASRVAIGKSEEFLSILNSGKLKRGNVIIFDEAGVGIPSREWWDECNRLVDYVLQTFRHMNLGVIFTTPDTSYIDSQARKVFHDYLETMKIDYTRKLCTVKPLEMQNNPRMGKMYYHWSLYKGAPIKKLRVSMPSENFIKLYEPQKKLFSLELNLIAEETIRKRQNKQMNKMSDEEVIETGNKEGLDWKDMYAIQARFQMGFHRSKRIQKRLGIDSPTKGVKKV